MLSRTKWLRLIPLGLVGLIAAGAVSVALAFPTPSLPWLSKNQGGYTTLGTDQEALSYYNAITGGAPATLALWKSAYGFNGVNPEVQARYYNGGDLGFGREMHCRDGGTYIACYVANHGFGPASPPTLSVDAAINGTLTGPVVAMVYMAALSGAPNAVTFYIYNNDAAGSLITHVPLDGDGEKYLPRLCLPCHGGTYDPNSHMITGGNFLPFDTDSFRYSAQAGYRLADQRENFRQLNALVYSTTPTQLIRDLISGWYNNQVGTPNQPFDSSYVPADYSINLTDAAVYTEIVKPYCRSCHIAQGTWTLGAPAQLGGSARFDVFSSHVMPHAQLTSHNFWSSDAPAILADNRGWSIQVTNTNDSGPGSLRQAIADANVNAKGSPAIITFADLGGPATYSLSTGELAIANSMTILGRGASQTIVDGNNLSRVIHISPGATVIIKGVTIQGGSSSDFGGGIYNQGGALTLLASTLKNNTSNNGGGGIVNVLGTTTIEGSAIGPNNRASAANGVGGGIYNNGGTLTIENTTVSGNASAYLGGGLINNNNGVVTATQTTIVNNSASGDGGGVYNDTGSTLTFQGNVVGGNTGLAPYSDCHIIGPYQWLGRNLLGSNGSANGCPVSGSAQGSDIVLTGTLDTVLNTNLVGDGSGVAYHALIPGSPAIDANSVVTVVSVSTPGCALPLYDQRNVARPLDGNGDGSAACDIGAREFSTANVTTASDVVSATDGLCSLREAVTAANTGQPSGREGGECPGSPDVINLAVPGPYDLTTSELGVSGESGLNIQGAVTINGNGQVIRRNSSAFFRIFFVASGGNLNLERVTLRDGLSDGRAGGGLRIDMGGVANIRDSAILNNQAVPDSSGGGILNAGTLNMVNSTIAGNAAGGNGGGLAAWNESVTDLVNVTVRANVADVDQNGYGEGGGLAQDGGLTITVKSGLIAGNTDNTPLNVAPGIIQPDIAGALVSADYNLIGDERGSAEMTLNAHDLVGAVGAPLDPGLGTLTGSPAFYPLLAGSPAIDRIPPAACVVLSTPGNPLFLSGASLASDQRGVARPADGNLDLSAACDVGAFEFAPLRVFLPGVFKGP